MEFFEFFFSGPNWGWKVFALIWLTNVVLNGIAMIIKAIYEGKTVKIVEEIKTLTEKDKDENNSAITKDDFR
jgi:hypothetical protein